MLCAPAKIEQLYIGQKKATVFVPRNRSTLEVNYCAQGSCLLAITAFAINGRMLMEWVHWQQTDFLHSINKQGRKIFASAMGLMMSIFQHRDFHVQIKCTFFLHCKSWVQDLALIWDTAELSWVISYFIRVCLLTCGNLCLAKDVMLVWK